MASLVYGSGFTPAEVAKQLKNLNRDYYGQRTWSSMYSSIDLAKSKAENQALLEYNTDIAEAYNASLQNDAAILNSNMGQGYKAAMLDDTDAALTEAYNAYRQNYLNNLSNIEQTAAENNAAVTNQLNTQAQYTADYANAHFDYLKYLYEEQSKLEDAQNIFINDPQWSKYTIVDSDGNRRLKTTDELIARGQHEMLADGTKQWTGLYDVDGNLTIKGADFFDQIENQVAQEGTGTSFGQWLAEQDAKNKTNLFEWATSYNPYDWTEAGTNKGSFKTMVGLTSTDEQYSFIERYGGLSEGEVKSMYDEFSNKVSDIAKSIDKNNDTRDVQKQYAELANDIENYSDKLGVDIISVLNDAGLNISSLSDLILDYNGKDVASSIGTTVGMGIIGGVSGVGAASLGAALAGSTLGPVGTAVGAIVGAIGGLITSIINISETNKADAEYETALRDNFNNVLASITNYNLAQQRQKQHDFYNK